MGQTPTVEPVAGPGGLEDDVTTESEPNGERKIIELPKKNMWRWSVESGHVSFSKSWADSLGFSLDELRPEVDQWKELVHPEDLSRTMDTVGDYLTGKTTFYFCFNRLRMKNGSYRGNLDTGKIVEWKEDKPLLMEGSDLEIEGRI